MENKFIKILFVEDELTSRRILYSFLGPLGEVDIAVNGNEALTVKVAGKNGASEIHGLNRSTLRARRVNLTSENHKFSSRFQFTLIICHP